MAQAAIPRMWRDSAEAADTALRRPAAVAAAGEVNWRAWYIGLAVVTVFLVCYVAVAAFASELDTIKYRLQQEIGLLRSHQSATVRIVNDRAGYAALQPIIARAKLTTRPAGVLPLSAGSALPAETPTVLRSPQPYQAYAAASGGRPAAPAEAGIRSLP